MRSKVLRFFVIVTIIAAPLFGEGLGCPPGARPLIKAMGYRSLDPPATFRSIKSRDAILICDQGIVLSARLSERPVSTLPETATIERGTASRAAMAELRAAMITARIGFREDCRFVGTLGVGVGSRIKWFGAGRRVHSFDMTPDTGDLPPCDLAAIMLLEALDTVAGSARQSADDEQVDFP